MGLNNTSPWRNLWVFTRLWAQIRTKSSVTQVFFVGDFWEGNHLTNYGLDRQLAALLRDQVSIGNPKHSELDPLTLVTFNPLIFTRNQTHSPVGQAYAWIPRRRILLLILAWLIKSTQSKIGTMRYYGKSWRDTDHAPNEEQMRSRPSTQHSLWEGTVMCLTYKKWTFLSHWATQASQQLKHMKWKQV